jgi:hypothetical protein
VTVHRVLREQLGAYALGALEPRERAEVDAHLQECASCREELARLAALPGLLARVSPDEAADPRPAPGDVGERALAALATRRRDERRRRRRWGAGLAAAAATVVALGLVVVATGGDGGGRGVPLRIEPVAADAGSVAGTAWAEGREWGTAIGVDLRRLPDRPAYALTAIARDGHREVAATWAATEAGAAEVEGSCAIRPDEMAGYEVTAGDGEVLVRLEAGPWG